MSTFTKFGNAYGYWEEDNNQKCMNTRRIPKKTMPNRRTSSMIYSTDPTSSQQCKSRQDCLESRPWCENYGTYCQGGEDGEIFIPELPNTSGVCTWGGCPSRNPFPTPIPTNAEEGSGYYNCVQWGCRRSFEIPGGDKNDRSVGKDCYNSLENCCDKCGEYQTNCQSCNKTDEFDECDVSADAIGYCLAQGFGYPTNNFNVGNVDCVSCTDYEDELTVYTEKKLIDSGWSAEQIDDYMNKYTANFNWTHDDHKVPSNCLSECTKTAGQFAPNPNA